MLKNKQLKNRIYAIVLVMVISIGTLFPSSANPFIQVTQADSIEFTNTGTEINSKLKHLVNPSASIVLNDRTFVNASVDVAPEETVASVNQALVDSLQASINNLPSMVSADNYQELQNQLSNIDSSFSKLSQEELALIDLSNYYATQNLLSSFYDSLSTESAIIIEEESVSSELESFDAITDTEIETTTQAETDPATEIVQENESTIDSIIQAIVWSDVAPSEDIQTVSLSTNGKLVAWYVDGQTAKQEAISNGTDRFTVYDANGNPITIYNDYLNTIYLYYNQTSKDDFIYFNPDMSHAFQNLSALTDISGLQHIHSDYVTDMSFMFAGDKSLSNLGALASFNTKSVTNVSYMFLDCVNIFNVQEFLNPHVYDSKASENSLKRDSYFALLSRYMSTENISTPYDTVVTYDMLNAQDKLAYSAPYASWDNNSIVCDGAFSGTNVTEYPNWYYTYFGIELPTEEIKEIPENIEEVSAIEDEISTETEEELVENDIIVEDDNFVEENSIDIIEENGIVIDSSDDADTEEISESDTIIRIPENVDFSSQRLIIGTSNVNILSEMPIISSYNGIYILQFESIEQTQIAYSQLVDVVEFIEVDTGIQVADEISDEIVTTDTVMTEAENPFEELKDAIENESSNISYDIALIDTGAELSANVVNAVSMLGDDPSDDNGHGTKMVSYILEQNPDARILSIKAFDASGKADISAVYAAFEYAISQNVKIINLSASAIATQDNSIVAEVIRKAIANGITVVGSAGNNGNNVAYYIPGNIDEAYIIGACNADGERLSSSNYGATVDYNVVASSTSEAAAKFSGYISKNGVENIPDDDIIRYNSYNESPSSNSTIIDTPTDALTTLTNVTIREYYDGAEKYDVEIVNGILSYQLHHLEDIKEIRVVSGNRYYLVDNYTVNEDNIISFGISDIYDVIDTINIFYTYTRPVRNVSFSINAVSDDLQKALNDFKNIAYSSNPYVLRYGGSVIVNNNKIQLNSNNAWGNVNLMGTGMGLWYGSYDTGGVFGSNWAYTLFGSRSAALATPKPGDIYLSSDVGFGDSQPAGHVFIITDVKTENGKTYVKVFNQTGNDNGPYWAGATSLPTISGWVEWTGYQPTGLTDRPVTIRYRCSDSTIANAIAESATYWVAKVAESAENSSAWKAMINYVTPSNSSSCYVGVMFVLYDLTETSKYIEFGKSVTNNNGSFRVTKSVSSDISSDTNTSWTFTLSRTPNETYRVTIYNANGTVATAARDISSNGGTFSLKHGQYADITGVPQGRQVKVTETENSLFTTKVGTTTTREHTFTIPSNPASTYSFKVSGLPSGNFDYYTYSTSIGSTRTGTISNNGSISISNGQKVRITGLPANQRVTITETAPSSTGGSWSYNPSNRTLSGTANDNSLGTQSNTFTPTRQSATWTNTRKRGNISAQKAVSTPTGSIKLTKTVDSIVTADNSKSWQFTLSSNASSAETYKITIYNANGTVATSERNISSSGGTFNLVKDQYAIITGIPQGRTVTATETNYTSSLNEQMYTTTVGTTTTREVSYTIPSNSVTSYTFTVSGLPPGYSYDYYRYASTENRPGTRTGTITNGGTITLSANQKFDILNLPAGITVTISESAPTAITGATWSTTNNNNGSSGYTWTASSRTMSHTVVADATTSYGTWTNTLSPTRIEKTINNKRDTINVTFQKQSTNNTCTAQLANNSMYSQDYKDAEFTVTDGTAGSPYVAQKPTAYNSTTRIATFTRTVAVGDTVTITETKAPKGYLLPSQRVPAQSNVISKVISRTAANNTFLFSDEPTFDPGGLLLRKGIYDNAGKLTVSNDNKPVSGVVFKFEYFDNLTHSGTPTKTWYFVTDEDGEISFTSDYIADNAANWQNRNEAGTVYSDTVNRSLWQNSSNYHVSDTIRAGQYLYKNNQNFEDLPLGSIRVTEVFAPAGYIINNTVLTGTIRQNTTSGTAAFSWDSNSDPSVLSPVSSSANKNANFGNYQKYGSIEIHKEDVEMVKAQGDANFKDIQVTIYNKSGYEIILGDDAGTHVADGAAICTLTFGTDGTTEDVVSTYKYFGNKDVIPIGATLGERNATSTSDTAVDWPYEVRETKTNQMYHLNGNWKMSVRMYDPDPYNKNAKITPVYKVNNGGITNPNTNRLEADTNTNTVNNQSIRGGVSFKKLDQNRAVTQDDDANLKTPQGDAVLGNGTDMTEITIYNVSRVVSPWDGSIVNKDGTTIPTGISVLNNIKTKGFDTTNFQRYIVQQVYTDKDGFATTGTTDLPYGTYIAKETAKPDGYDINEDWYVIFQIREEGVVVNTWDKDMKTTQNYNVGAKSGWLETAGQYSNKTVTAARAEDDIYRGGVTFTKYDENSLTTGATEDTLGKAVIGVYNISLEDVYVKNDDGDFVWSNTEKAKYDELSASDKRKVAEYFRNNVTPLFTLESDENGVFTTDSNKDGKDETLPYGSYIAIELFQPDGYNLNEEWYVAFQIHPNKDADRGIILDTKEASNYKKEKKGDVDTTCYFDVWAGVSDKYGVSLPLDKWFYTGGNMTQTLTGLIPQQEYTLTLYGSGTVNVNVNDSSASVRVTASAPGLYTFKTSNGIAHITISRATSITNTMLTFGNGRNADGSLNDGTGRQYDMTSGKLQDTWNELILFKVDGGTNTPMSGVKFKIWTEEVADNVAIGLDKDGNRFYNNQIFTTDSQGLISLKKLFSGENEHNEQYKLGWRVFHIQEVSDDITGYLTDHTVKAIMVDRDGFVHQEYENDGNANVTYKEAAEAYAQALTDRDVAIADQSNAQKQITAARQILAEAQAAQARAKYGNADSVDGTANAVAYAQEQLANAQAYLNRANSAYSTANSNITLAKRAMDNAEAANNYSQKAGTAIYAMNIADIHVVPLTLAAGGPGTKIIYLFGGGLLTVMLGAYMLTRRKRKNINRENVA